MEGHDCSETSGSNTEKKTNWIKPSLMMMMMMMNYTSNKIRWKKCGFQIVADVCLLQEGFSLKDTADCSGGTRLFFQMYKFPSVARRLW